MTDAMKYKNFFSREEFLKGIDMMNTKPIYFTHLNHNLGL